ncbi:hypothetical protein LBMAG18_00560 [Alphaproteobacteria bacterium]|nr:hypothetical protein LBMAG18_00560 [Alphaproteobacteria bacterium]
MINYHKNSQKIINKNFLIKSFSQIAIILTAFNANANAIPLKISTKNACVLLEQHGLKANGPWQKNIKTANNSIDWGCSNFNNNQNTSAPINFNYTASGDAKEVQNIEITAHVNDKNYARLASKKLLDISEIVSKSSIGSSISSQLKEAIINGDSFAQQIGESFINFTQVKVSSGSKESLVMIFNINTTSNNNFQ